jgi:hypothetical protein
MPLVLELDDVDAWLGATPDEAAVLMRPAKDVLQEGRWAGDQQRQEQCAGVAGVPLAGAFDDRIRTRSSSW